MRAGSVECASAQLAHPASCPACRSRTAGVVVGKLASADEAAEAGHVCTMLMEALVVLLNHEVGGLLRVCLRGR